MDKGAAESYGEVGDLGENGIPLLKGAKLARALEGRAEEGGAAREAPRTRATGTTSMAMRAPMAPSSSRMCPCSYEYTS